jgi:hypothetical protein
MPSLRGGAVLTLLQIGLCAWPASAAVQLQSAAELCPVEDPLRRRQNAGALHQRLVQGPGGTGGGQGGGGAGTIAAAIRVGLPLLVAAGVVIGLGVADRSPSVGWTGRGSRAGA